MLLSMGREASADTWRRRAALPLRRPPPKRLVTRVRQSADLHRPTTKAVRSVLVQQPPFKLRPGGQAGTYTAWSAEHAPDWTVRSNNDKIGARLTAARSGRPRHRLRPTARELIRHLGAAASTEQPVDNS